MHPILEKEFRKLEKSSLRLEQQLKGIPPARFQQPEAEGKWCLAQVIHHLVAAEEASLHYLKKKTATKSNFPRAGMGASFRMGLLMVSQVLPLKFKAPEVVAQPPSDGTCASLFGHWQVVRSDMQSFLSAFPDDMMPLLVYKHPVAGMFTLRQSLMFLRYHIRHHQRQINRILRATK